MKHEEHNLQVACVKWFDLQHRPIKHLFWATPNGGKRNKIEAERLKMEGVRAGVPDLFLALPAKEWSGLFIELKIGNNNLTKAQKEHFKHLPAVGFKCTVIRSFDEFVNEINKYLT